MRNTSFLCAAISSKNGGLNGWAFTNVLWKQVINMLYRNEAQRNATKTEKEPISVDTQNDLFKATLSQRQSNYYGFVKTGFKKMKTPGSFLNTILAPRGRFWCHFWPHRISKRVPKSTSFEKHLKHEKNVQDAAFSKHVFRSIFDTKMRGQKS